MNLLGVYNSVALKYFIFVSKMKILYADDHSSFGIFPIENDNNVLAVKCSISFFNYLCEVHFISYYYYYCHNN